MTAMPDKEIWPEIHDPDFPSSYHVVRMQTDHRTLPFQYDDGGRSSAPGIKGNKDCVARSLAIVTGRCYADIYQALSEGNAAQRCSKRSPKRACRADNGVNTQRKWFKNYMHQLGYSWTPCIIPGSHSRIYLREGDLPVGRLVVAVSGHYTAVINGVIHDTFDCGREGTRCVRGFWSASPLNVRQ